MEFKIENGILLEVRGLKFDLVFNEILPKEVIKIGKSAFAKCPYFTEITIPNTIEEIEDEAFIENRMLKKIIIPDTVKKVGIKAFAGCENLEEIQFSDKTYFGLDCFEKDYKIKKFIRDGVEAKTFCFPENEQYAITFLKPEMSTEEYKAYVGNFISISFFPRENKNTNIDPQYFVVTKKGEVEKFWFSPDIELAKIGALWAASDKGAAEFFGSPFTDESILSIEEFSLLIGTCTIGRRLWNFLGAVYEKNTNKYKIKDIKNVLHEEWPEIEERFNTLLERQHQDFNYLDMKYMIPTQVFRDKLKQILIKYKVSKIEQ